MRSLFIASLVVSGIFATGVGAVQRRKTLGFGPEHPHKVFKSSPYQIQLNADFRPAGNASPFDLARHFVRDQLGPDAEFYLRKDSYTDTRTGVTHVYVRQLVNGIDVADGDMNINIKDGVVLSYGNSFFPGPAPAMFDQPDPEMLAFPHTDYCQKLINHLELSRSMFTSEQVPMQSTHKATHLEELDHIYHSNCVYHDLPESLSRDQFTSAADPADFRPALLQFMIAATPSEHLADDIQAQFSKYMKNMHISDVSHLASVGSPVEFVVDNVPDAVSPVNVKMAYIQVPNKAKTETTLHLVWKFEVQMQDNWYETAVSAAAPHRIISVVDWASDSPIPEHDPHPKASYEVFRWGVNDPLCGGRTLETENIDTLASPVGWHAFPHANDPVTKHSGARFQGYWRNTTTTMGNNIFAQENWKGFDRYLDNERPEVDASDMTFSFPYAPKAGLHVDPMDEAKSFLNATVTQLFYTTNMIHDFYYRYGFDEVSGNFQQYNFGRGGEENDAVITNAQDGSGMNNANFMTPPDGRHGQMRMFLWDTAIPYRDGDFEAGIVIHEFSHGLSTRLTGGPKDSSCLGWGEAGGMGEGWGDFLATMIRSRKGETEYAMGAWAANRTAGIRHFIYSTDDTVNPSMYKTLDSPGYWGVHAIGEVWAEILWVAANALIEEHGYSHTLYPPLPLADGTIPDGDFYRPTSATGLKVPKHGNTLSVQLVISAMKLQPCRPGFFDARDAIIQADQILTGGENFCTLWKSFAKRGLGVDAKVEGRTPWGGGVRTNGFTTPRTC